MCRYDDDYAWVVDSYNERTATEPTRCEDCGRAINTSERFWEVVGDPSDTDGDERPIRNVALCSGQYAESYDFGADAIVFDWDDTPTIGSPEWDAFQALGFKFEEVRWGSLEMVYSNWCKHCRAAHAWLEDVCSQGTILVSHEDIDSHWDEYGNAQELGWAFIKLAWFNRNGWRDRRDNLVPSEQIVDLTSRAIEYAHTPAGLAGRA